MGCIVLSYLERTCMNQPRKDQGVFQNSYNSEHSLSMCCMSHNEVSQDLGHCIFPVTYGEVIFINLTL